MFTSRHWIQLFNGTIRLNLLMINDPMTVTVTLDSDRSLWGDCVQKVMQNSIFFFRMCDRDRDRDRDRDLDAMSIY